MDIIGRKTPIFTAAEQQRLSAPKNPSQAADFFGKTRFSRIARGGSSLLVLALLLAVQPAGAQTTTIPPSGNLDTAAMANNGSWVLEGDAYTLTLAAGRNLPTTFSIAGAAGGTTITNTATLSSYGIYRNTTSPITLTLSDLTFTGGNTSGGSGAGYGGVIASSSGITMTTSNVVFSSNQSGSRGGAIHVSSGGLAIDGDAAFLNNSSGAATGATAPNGGAVNVGGGALSITRAVTATGNTITSGSGGAFYSQLAATLANQSGAVSLTGNSATSHGGALFSAAGGVTIGNTAAPDTVTITGNKAGYTNNTTANTTANGGGISSGATTTLHGSAITLSDNIATLNGGGIYSAQAVTINGAVTADSNTALNGSGGAINAQAGGVAIDGMLTAIGNVASVLGGAVYAATGNVEATGAVNLDRNIAKAGMGGGVYAANGNVNLATASGNASLTGNIAASSGGAVFAAGSGGGVAIGNTSGTVTITGNKAGFAADGVTQTFPSNGGAIDAGTGTTTLTGTAITLSENVATLDGGGIYSVRMVTVNGALTAEGNTALTGSGGAINAQAGGVVVNGTLAATGNIAGQSGGAILAASGNISVSGATSASGNVATAGLGGAINAGNGSVRLATSNGDVSLTDNQAGVSGGAIRQGGSGSVAIGNGAGTIAMTGNKAATDGGAIYSAGSTTLTGSTVTVQDNMATAGSGGAIYAVTDVTLTAASPAIVSGNSAGARGGAIWAGNDVTLNATTGNIVFTGNMQASGANAIYLNNGAGTGIATFDAAAGRAITFFDPVASNPDNGSVSVVKTGAGTVSFDGSNYADPADQWSQVFADTRVQAGTFEIANNAVYGALSADATPPAVATSFTSEAGTTVQGGVMGTIRADAVTLNGDLDIAGRQPDTRGVFAISTGALTLGGGNIYFNTYLDDGSSQNTDLLVLDLHGSATSGQSFIVVNPVGGTGAYTTGDGIKLVETDGTGTTAGAFALGNRVAAGAYEYRLFYGGNAADGGDADDQNWYLRNVYTPQPTPDNPTPQPVPIIRPEVPIAMAVPPLALEYGYAMLDTLHERVGERYGVSPGQAYEERTVRCHDRKRASRCIVRVPVTTPGSQKSASSGWARLFGDRGLHQPDNFSRRGPNYDYTFGGIQAGLDLWARQQVDGTLDKAGIYAGYGQITSNVKGQFGGKAGSVDMDAYTLAGYWTHYDPTGWYTDAVVQGTWYSADAKSVLGQRTKPDGFGILTSLEGGYAFKLGNGFTLEPQAQMVYQNVSFDSARDAYGLVRFDDSDSLRGRLGLRLTRTWNTMATDRQPRLVTTWLRANVWHEFLGKSTTSWGSLSGGAMVPFNTYLGGTWGEIGAGVTAQVSDAVNLFATGAYNRSLDGKGRQGWDGRIGAAIKW